MAEPRYALVVARFYEELAERLERGARPLGVEVGEEGVLEILEHQRRVEARGQPLGERRGADSGRPLDGDVTKPHDWCGSIVRPPERGKPRPRKTAVLSWRGHPMRPRSAAASVA